MLRKNTSGVVLAPGSIFAMAVAAAMGAPATAQDRPDGSSADESVEEIIVTGSRIPRRDFTGPSPVLTIDAMELRLSGTQNLEEAIESLPQAVPAFGRSTNNPGNGRSTINLRGLGDQRTLLLLNGRRFIASNTNGVTDINNIPAGMIARSEVVTGGASAVYGSDAIAGAVNFIMKEDFTGLELSVQYDETERNDGDQLDVSMAAGMEFADGRGHVSGFVDYYDRDSIYQGDRAFSEQVIMEDIFTGELIPGGSPNTPAGAIRNPALVNGVPAPLGVTFEQDGTPRPQVFADAYNFGPANYLQTPMERWSFAGFLNYDLTDTTRAYLDLMYVDNDSAQELAPTLFIGQVAMNLDNPFVTPETRQLLVDNFDPDGDGVANFVFGKRLPNLGSRVGTNESELERFVAGATGDLDNGMTWDLHVIHAEVDFVETIRNNARASSFRQALLVDPVSGECFDPSGGCVPLNPFGEGSISDAALDYIRVRPATDYTYTEQDIANVSLVGDFPLFLPDPIGFAVGYEWRRDESLFEPDPLRATNDVTSLGSAQPVEGTIIMRELFGELYVPLLMDRRFAHELSIEGGYRYTDHSIVGDFTTWKLGAQWAPFEDLTLRASLQEAVRAPNAEELFEGENVGFNPWIAQFSDLCSAQWDPAALGIADICIAQGIPASEIGVYQSQPFFLTEVRSGGNLELTEETSDTFTAGFVYQPSWAENLSISADYYSIEVDDAIEWVFDDIVVSACFALRDPAHPLCQSIERNDPSFNITNIKAGYGNIARVKVEGIDYQIDWETDLPQWLSVGSETASMQMRILGGHVKTNGSQAAPGTPFYNCAGLFGFPCNITSFGTVPENKTKTRLTYLTGPTSVSLEWRWLDGMDSAFQQFAAEQFALPADLIQVAVPELDDEHYFALSFDYAINDTLDIYGGIKNLTDNDPPVFGFGSQSNTEPTVYDVYGRRYFLGFVSRFGN